MGVTPKLTLKWKLLWINNAVSMRDYAITWNKHYICIHEHNWCRNIHCGEKKSENTQGWHCGSGWAATSNAGIPCSHQFKSCLLPFQSSSLLMPCESSGCGCLGPCIMRETWKMFLANGFVLAQPRLCGHLRSKAENEKSLSQ